VIGNQLHEFENNQRNFVVNAVPVFVTVTEESAVLG
jgi:hypothetical protein